MLPTLPVTTGAATLVSSIVLSFTVFAQAPSVPAALPIETLTPMAPVPALQMAESPDHARPGPDVSKQIADLLERHAPDLKPSDRTLLRAFAHCESFDAQFEDDGSPLMSGYGSPDCGAFQINKIHWDGKTAETSKVCVSLEANVRMAIALYRDSGSAPWNNSKACWVLDPPHWSLSTSTP